MGFTLDTGAKDREQSVVLKYFLNIRNHALGTLDSRVNSDLKHKLSIYVR